MQSQTNQQPNSTKSFSTFNERNELLKRLDKLPKDQRDMVNLKHQGAMSVVMDDPKYWTILQNYIAEYESQQPLLPLTLTDELNATIDKAARKKLDNMSVKL